MSSRLNPDPDIETLYSPSRWSKRYTSEEVLKKHVEYITEHSREVRTTVPGELEVEYGPGKNQKLDIYGIDLPSDVPIYIHIHGGYWQETVIGRENSAFVMKTLHKLGVKGIIIGYDLCPNVTLEEILQQIRQAFVKCIEYAKKHNSRGIIIGGHSAGGHLAASLFQDYFDQKPVDEELVKAVFLISGVYNLVPLLNTTYNEALKLDKSTAQDLSPLFRKFYGRNDIKLYIIIPSDESPAFQEQSALIYDKLKASNLNCHLITVPDTDHFNIVENLTQEGFTITKLIHNLVNTF